MALAALSKHSPRRVVPGAAEYPDTGVILHLDEMAVPARGDQAEKRRGQIRMGQIVGGDMGTQMVDRDEWEAGGVGQPFHEIHPRPAGRR